MSAVTKITMQPRGPGGTPQTYTLEWLRENAEGYILDGAETKAEQALAAVVVALIDKIYDMNHGLEDL